MSNKTPGFITLGIAAIVVAALSFTLRDRSEPQAPPAAEVAPAMGEGGPFEMTNVIGSIEEARADPRRFIFIDEAPAPFEPITVERLNCQREIVLEYVRADQIQIADSPWAAGRLIVLMPLEQLQKQIRAWRDCG